jgi:predicted nucleotidyltransferase
VRLPFSVEQLEALHTLRSLCYPHIPFVLVGASAIHCHRPTPRGTRDLDVTLAVSLGELPAGLQRAPGWRRHHRHAHEWIGPGDVSVDLVPAGPSLLAQGHLLWPGGYRMNLAGFERAFAQARPMTLTPTLTVDVASLAAIALLKMVAFLDRPDVRERDLEDLAYLLHDYVPEDDERRWSDELLALQLEFDQVSA